MTTDVKKTFASFLDRMRDIVGRLKPHAAPGSDESIDNACKLVGLAYDAVGRDPRLFVETVLKAKWVVNSLGELGLQMRVCREHGEKVAAFYYKWEVPLVYSKDQPYGPNQVAALQCRPTHKAEFGLTIRSPIGYSGNGNPLLDVSDALMMQYVNDCGFTCMSALLKYVAAKKGIEQRPVPVEVLAIRAEADARIAQGLMGMKPKPDQLN